MRRVAKRCRKRRAHLGRDHSYRAVGWDGSWRLAFERMEDRWLLSAPHVTEIIPPANSHSATVDTEVAATLDQAIDPTSLSSNTFAVHGMQTGQLLEPTNIISASGESLSLRPARSFFPGELVQVTATAGMQAAGGEPLERPLVWQFRTAVGQGNGGGTGLFHDTGQFLSVPRWRTEGVSQGDVDGDGDLDIVIANRVWVNDGQGTFTDSGQSLGERPSGAVALGDVDGDGDLDAVGSSVWTNDGQGRFADVGGDLGTASALGDLDGDGDLDAIGGSVWLNDGDGGYSDIGSAFHRRALTLGDLDGDGDLDAVGNRFWKNDGQGQFAESGGYLGTASALGDLDGDGDLDAIGQSVWLNEGEGNFVKTSQSFDSNAIALGDIDGDGDLDLLAGRRGDWGYAAPDLIWRNDGHGVFVDTGQQLGFLPTEAVALGDYDGDGDLDAFFAGNGVGRVWLNTDVHADLSVTNTDGQSTYLPGEQVTYTIAVRNHGPESLTGITVTDDFPESVADVTWTCSPTEGSTCTSQGVGDIDDTISLLPRGKATYRATGTVDVDTRGTISNTAILAAPSGLQDLDPANNRATDTTREDISRFRMMPLQAGDANQDGYFDASDTIQVLQAGKYLTGEPATWAEGDWDGAPGGELGDPPVGDGIFDQVDLIAALMAALYLTGAYADVGPPKADLACIGREGMAGDGQTSLIYDTTTDEFKIDAPAGRELTSIRIVSKSGIFTGERALNLGGSFDIDTDHEIFKATFGSSFGSLSFGNVIEAGLPTQVVQTDLKVDGSLAGGGDLGLVDWGHLNQEWPELVVIPAVAPIPRLTVQEDSPSIEEYVDLPFVYGRLLAKTIFTLTNTNPDLVTARVDHDGTLDLAFAPNTNGRATITVHAASEGSECTGPAYVDHSFRVTVLPSLSPGDVNADGRFDQLDIARVLEAGKYLTGDRAGWSEGDWNRDGVFDQLDIVAALQTGDYLQGPYAALMAKSEANSAVVDVLFIDDGR